MMPMQPGQPFGLSKGSVFQPRRPPVISGATPGMNPMAENPQHTLLSNVAGFGQHAAQNFRNIPNDDERKRQMLAFALGGNFGGVRG